MAKATFGAGCFWGVEAAFQQLDGVLATQVGYMGGWKEQPTYEEVCSKTTGHAEVVEVTYDPVRISYDQLLQVFLDCHDPTQLNRQGPDNGPNYRSVIFYHTPKQEKEARASLAREEASGRYCGPIVTEIARASTFWRAEEYHQHYLAQLDGATCH